MYQQKDRDENRHQLNKRLLALAIPMVFFLAGIIVSLLRNVRLQWLTILLTVLGGSMTLFCYSMFISPIVHYGRHLKNVLDGRKRETSGIVREIAGQACIREGVEYYPMTINVGDKNDEADDRLFYYDVHKGMPPVHPGDRVTVVSHDKAVADIRLAE